jgi:hypothetical protein
MTVEPIRKFVVKDLEIYKEYYTGERILLATCPDKERRNWLVDSLIHWHGIPLAEWEQGTNE